MASWTIKTGAAEFGVSEVTLRRYMRIAGIELQPRAKYSTQTIHKALHSDSKEARARLTSAQADKEEIEVARLRGELISRPEVLELLGRVLGPVREALITLPLSMAARCNPADPAMASAALDEWVDAALRGLREEALPKALEHKEEEHETQ